MPLLKVHQPPKEEIYKDMVRVNEAHRVNKLKETIKEGCVCRLRVNGSKCLAVLRGYQDSDLPQVRMDDYTRGRLKLKLNEPYEFEFKKVGLVGQWRWAWNATEMGYQVASRIALISFLMGLIGLVLGIIGLIK